MAVDFKSENMFRATHVLIEETELVLLDPAGRGQDKLRRFPYDRIDSMAVWTDYPVARILISMAFFGFWALITFAVADAANGGRAATLIPAAIGALVALRYVTVKRTNIRLARGGASVHLRVVMSQNKLEAKLARVRGLIADAQRRPEDTSNP